MQCANLKNIHVLSRWVHIFSFDVSSLSCYGGLKFDFVDKLRVQTLVPISLCLFCLVAWCIEIKLIEMSESSGMSLEEGGIELGVIYPEEALKEQPAFQQSAGNSDLIAAQFAKNRERVTEEVRVTIGNSDKRITNEFIFFKHTML